MNHDELESRINDLLDERRSPSADEALRAAVHENPAARDLLASYDALLASVARRTTPEPSADLSRRVLDELQPASVADSRPNRRIAARLALAASLLIVASLAGWMYSTGAFTFTASQQVAEQPAPPTVEPNDIPAPPLGRLARQAGDKYRELADSTGQSLSHALRAVPGLRSAPAATTANSNEQAESSDWMRRLASGFAPLAHSTESTVSSLLQAVPAAEEEPPS